MILLSTLHSRQKHKSEYIKFLSEYSNNMGKSVVRNVEIPYKIKNIITIMINFNKIKIRNTRKN